MTSQSAATTRALCVRVSFAACPKAPPTPLHTGTEDIAHSVQHSGVDTPHSKLRTVKTTQRAQHTAHYLKLRKAHRTLHKWHCTLHTMSSGQ